MHEDLHRYIFESVIYELFLDVKPTVKLRGTRQEVLSICEAVSACQEMHAVIRGDTVSLNEIKQKIDSYHKAVDKFNGILSEEFVWPL